MDKQNRHKSPYVLLLFVLVLSIGCAAVNKQHPMLVTKEVREGGSTNFASVYFIRPRPLKPKGVADDPITVEYQSKTLLTIDEGSHTLLHIKPGTGEIKVNSRTKFTNQLTPIKVWRARQYKFIEGKTYFIHLKRVDEEYRGIFYEPQPVKYDKAKALADDTLASGEARSNPIDKLTDFSEPPASAFENQAPALPENIYKQERYLK